MRLLNKVEYTQMVITVVHHLDMSKRVSMRERFGEKLTTFSGGQVPVLFCQFLSLDKRMRV